MGIDIYGSIEICRSADEPAREPANASAAGKPKRRPKGRRSKKYSEATGTWQGVESIDDLIGRDYDLFGCLFGVKNFADFEPVAANRGFPPDVSASVRRQCQEHGDDEDSELYGQTWISLEELRAIDLNEQARGPDQRVHEFTVEPDGSERFVTKTAWTSALEGHYEELDRRGELRIGPRIFRRVRIRRRDALGFSYQRLVARMEQLASKPDAAGVRVVVFFDC